MKFKLKFLIQCKETYKLCQLIKGCLLKTITTYMIQSTQKKKKQQT